MDVGLITVLMFGLMLLLLAVGLPVAFVLGGTAVFFAIFAWGPDAMNILVLNANSAMSATVLVAVPLFVFMAYMLQEAGIADDLYGAMHIWMGPLNGGLAAGTILASTIVAAMSGISTTGVILMGVIGLPSMLRRKYDKGIAMGSIMAGGALGSLIPPSILMIVYALLSGVSVGKLFLACVLPGLILSTFFITFILVRCYFNPSIGPALPAEERHKFSEKLRSTRGLVIPILLVTGVLGSIFGGFATPTEAAGVGAFGAILSAALHRKLTWKTLKMTNLSTLKTVVMIMWVVYGATCFASIYQGLGVTALLKDTLQTYPVSKWFILVVIFQGTWLILGCLMDSLSVLMVSAPVFLPLATYLGFDLLWLGVLFSINSEMDYLTPPFGVNLVVMKGIVPKGITMGDIYKCVWPFVIIQAITLFLIILVPGLATWLPNLVFKQ